MKQFLLINALAAVLAAVTQAAAVDFATIRHARDTMTSVAWDRYTASLQGESVCWKGWVSDVKEQWTDGYKVLVDMDPPGELSVQDVYLEDLPEATASRFSKEDHIAFCGTIKSVASILGSTQITFSKPDIK
jgi:hypothetical protein